MSSAIYFENIYDTEAEIKANLNNKQTAIMSDGNNEYLLRAGDNIYYTAYQKYYDIATSGDIYLIPTFKGINEIYETAEVSASIVINSTSATSTGTVEKGFGISNDYYLEADYGSIISAASDRISWADADDDGPSAKRDFYLTSGDGSTYIEQNVLSLETSATKINTPRVFTEQGGIYITPFDGGGEFELNSYNNNNASKRLKINYHGYNNGTSQYRDTYIYDGKENYLLVCQGSTGYICIGNNDPVEKLDVCGNIKADGSIQIGDNTTSASDTIVGAMRYWTSGTESYLDMCMQTSASTYEWINIKTNTWS